MDPPLQDIRYCCPWFCNSFYGEPPSSFALTTNNYYKQVKYSDILRPYHGKILIWNHAMGINPGPYSSLEHISSGFQQLFSGRNFLLVIWAWLKILLGQNKFASLTSASTVNHPSALHKPTISYPSLYTIVLRIICIRICIILYCAISLRTYKHRGFPNYVHKTSRYYSLLGQNKLKKSITVSLLRFIYRL